MTKTYTIEEKKLARAKYLKARDDEARSEGYKSYQDKVAMGSLYKKHRVGHGL